MKIYRAHTPTLSEKAQRKLPRPVRPVMTALLVLARDPEAEVTQTEHPKAEETDAQTLGWLPTLALTSTLGVFFVAHAYARARLGQPEAALFFWLGLLLIFAPATVRLLSPGASRFERISLLCVVGICFYLVNVMYSPLYFSGYDEFLHWRTAIDIGESQHLFTGNALLPVSPFYPGLEIVTNAFSSLSGLSTFIAGTIVVGVARLVMVLSLFLLYERITNSARGAGLTMIIYMANPHFLFFDAQFAYESLALPLATFILFIMASYHTFHGSRRWISLSTWLLLTALVMMHHATDFILDGFLLLWAAIYIIKRPAALRRSSLVQTALFGVFASLVWISLPGNPVVDYLFRDLVARLSELGQLVTSIGSVRSPFLDYSNSSTPLWQKVMTISSVALILLSLPFGLLCLWQRYRHNALASMFGIISLFYPLSQVFRLTNSGVEISDRISAFLFIPISCILAIFITQFLPTRWLGWKQILLVSCALSVVFLGSVILGNGPSWELLPGHYLVAADGRSIEPEGIQAAAWARSYLGPNNRMATDRTNQLLMSTYGEQRLVTPEEDHIDLTDIFFSSSLGDYEVSLLQQAQLRYLVVDLRLSQALPLVGFYFEEGEPGTFERTTPIDRAVLTKFSTIPQINRLFDSGDIVIYDVGGLSNSPETP